jgi:hypothetical protein
LEGLSLPQIPGGGYRIGASDTVSALCGAARHEEAARLLIRNCCSIKKCRSIELVAVDPGFRLDKRRSVTPLTVRRFLSVDDPSRLKREAVIGGTELEENLVARQASRREKTNTC